MGDKCTYQQIWSRNVSCKSQLDVHTAHQVWGRTAREEGKIEKVERRRRHLIPQNFRDVTYDFFDIHPPKIRLW